MPSLSGQWGKTITKVSGVPLASARSKSMSRRSLIRLMSPSSYGGPHSKQPPADAKSYSKNDPRLPNGASVSRNAEQNEFSGCALSGDANASPTLAPKSRRSAAKAALGVPICQLNPRPSGPYKCAIRCSILQAAVAKSPPREPACTSKRRRSMSCARVFKACCTIWLRACSLTFTPPRSCKFSGLNSCMFFDSLNVCDTTHEEHLCTALCSSSRQASARFTSSSSAFMSTANALARGTSASSTTRLASLSV